MVTNLQRYDGWTMRGITLRKQLMDGQQNLHCQYLDFLATRNISYTATWSKRSRYEKRLALKVKDGPQLGLISDRDVFLKAARVLESLHPEKKNESDNDHSMNICDQILDNKVGIGTSTNRRRHLLSSTTWWHEPQKKRMARSGMVWRVVITVSR